ncbi:hypothetical protein OG729_15175 [Streptomyces sp. NBC_00210]|uniref:hypothetical protein n=1 Tax=unclassified Streptomyces TaxID=2593676 RepID=UPI0032505217
MTPKGRIRRAAAALAVLIATAALGGCGIRTTQVPVDAGPAPSRVPCEVTSQDLTPQAQPKGVPVRVYLVCASQLESVDRTARVSEKAVGSRTGMARALIDELAREPSSPEHEAGFATYVRGPLVLSGPRPGDPAGTLRLSRQPEDLPPAALAQIVCTFAEGRAAAADGSVVLGGPGEYAPRGYRCSAETKERPEEPVPTLGALPSPSS